MKVCILYDPGLRCSHPTSFDGGRNWLTNPREWSISQFSNRSSPTSSYRLTGSSSARSYLKKHPTLPRCYTLNAKDKKMVNDFWKARRGRT